MCQDVSRYAKPQSRQDPVPIDSRLEDVVNRMFLRCLEDLGRGVLLCAFVGPPWLSFKTNSRLHLLPADPRMSSFRFMLLCFFLHANLQAVDCGSFSKTSP